MITSLHVKGFKSWRDSGELSFGKLTGFFGTNSSGKTSLLQLLLVLKQTAESADRSQVLRLGDDRTLVGLGNLRDVLFAHSSDGELWWSCAWQDPDELAVPEPDDPKKTLNKSDALGFEATVSPDGGNGQGRVVSFTYSVGSERFTYKARGKTTAAGYDLVAENRDNFFRKTVGRPRPKLPSPVKCYGFPDEVRVEYQNAAFLFDLQLRLEQLMKRMYYLGPLRAYPHRQYPWAGAQPEDMGGSGERWVEALLASRTLGKKAYWGRKTLEGHVAQWLKRLGLVHDFRVEPLVEGGNLYSVKVKTAARASEVLITDVGFGVSQILPVLVLCFYAPRGSTILLEQPEIHLHPSVQAGLADVLIDAIKRRHVQIILESHSEHLLRRLQRRIAEEELDTADAYLYFCRMDRGESKIDRLNLNLYGYIENWPDGFFGDQMEEIAAMTEAARRRREQS